MRISHIQQAYGAEIQKAAGNNRNVSKSEKTDRSDSVSLSKKARELSNSSAEVQSTAQRIEGLPDVRVDKINEVKEKLANGYYDTSEFVDKLADRLMKDFGFPKA